MKTKHAIKLTIIVWGLCLQAFGQSADSLNIQHSTPDILGTWYFVYSYPYSTDTMTFSRTTKAPHGWGQRIEINKNGEFVDAYSAKCGNDEAIHHTVGTWTYDDNTKLFETTIPVNFKDKKYKLSLLTPDKLLLVKP